MLSTISNFFRKPEASRPKIAKVWNIEDEPKKIYPDGQTIIYVVTVLVEYDGMLFKKPMYFSTEESKDRFIKHFKTTIEPFEVEVGEDFS